MLRNVGVLNIKRLVLQRLYIELVVLELEHSEIYQIIK